MEAPPWLSSRSDTWPSTTRTATVRSHHQQQYRHRAVDAHMVLDGGAVVEESVVAARKWSGAPGHYDGVVMVSGVAAAPAVTAEDVGECEDSVEAER